MRWERKTIFTGHLAAREWLAGWMSDCYNHDLGSHTVLVCKKKQLILEIACSQVEYGILGTIDWNFMPYKHFVPW